MGSGSLAALMAQLHSFRRPTHFNNAAGSTDRSCTTTTTAAAPPRALVRQDDDRRTVHMDDLYKNCNQPEDASMNMPELILKRNAGSCRCSSAETQQPAAISSSCEFDVALADGLQHLQLNMNGGGGSPHLNWLLHACAVSLSTLSSFASLLHNLNPSPSRHHHRQQAHHPIRPAGELFNLLDVCIFLQHIADDADRHLLLLQRALLGVGQALHQSSASKLRTAARRLRSRLHSIQGLASRPYRHVAEAHAALLLAAKRSTAAAAAPRPIHPAPHPILNPALDAVEIKLCVRVLIAVCRDRDARW